MYKSVERGWSAAGSRCSLPSCLGTAVGSRLAVAIVEIVENSGAIEVVVVAAVAERFACFETVDQVLIAELVVPIEGMGSMKS